MKNRRNNILLISGILGAVVAIASASVALCMLENSGDVCYLMKRKAKKALKNVESKIEEKLDC